MKRIIVGISGATGAIYGIRILETLREIDDVETHLIISNTAELIIRQETSWRVREVKALANFIHGFNDFEAAVASGSFNTEGMVIAPCSIKTMSMLANSMNANLLIRAADVSLKENRKLIAMVRETPLHLGHLRLMSRLAEVGASIAPPMPAFYHKPECLDDLINQTAGRVLAQLGIETDLYKTWNGVV